MCCRVLFVFINLKSIHISAVSFLFVCFRETVPKFRYFTGKTKSERSHLPRSEIWWSDFRSSLRHFLKPLTVLTFPINCTKT